MWDEQHSKELAMNLIRDAGMSLKASDYLDLLRNVISDCLAEIEDHRTQNAREILESAIADFQTALERMRTKEHE